MFTFLTQTSLTMEALGPISNLSSYLVIANMQNNTLSIIIHGNSKTLPALSQEISPAYHACENLAHSLTGTLRKRVSRGLFRDTASLLFTHVFCFLVKCQLRGQ